MSWWLLYIFKTEDFYHVSPIFMNEKGESRQTIHKRIKIRRQDVLYLELLIFFYCTFIVAFMWVLFHFYGYICFYCNLMSRHKHINLTKKKYINIFKASQARREWERPKNCINKCFEQMNCGFIKEWRVPPAFLWSIKSTESRILRWLKA